MIEVNNLNKFYKTNRYSLISTLQLIWMKVVFMDYWVQMELEKQLL